MIEQKKRLISSTINHVAGTIDTRIAAWMEEDGLVIGRTENIRCACRSADEYIAMVTNEDIAGCLSPESAADIAAVADWPG
jgi:hypothetical protein